MAKLIISVKYVIIFIQLNKYVKFSPGDVVDHQSTGSTAVIAACHRSESLLSGRVPYLQFNFLSADFYDSGISQTKQHQSFIQGKLNDYRKFDHRIKCSISFSFVSHSILELLIFRVSVTVRQRRREVAVCLLTSPVASCRRLLPHGRVSGKAVGGGSRLPTELPRCVGRVTETVIVVDTCLDHCLRHQVVSPQSAFSQQTFRDERMLKF